MVYLKSNILSLTNSILIELYSGFKFRFMRLKAISNIQEILGHLDYSSLTIILYQGFFGFLD